MKRVFAYAFTPVMLAVSIALPCAAANAASAAPAAHAKAASAPMYACSICHHRVTAAEAKKLHYTCPVDHGKLVAVKPR